MKKTILSQVDRLPPCLCYIVAHRGLARRPNRQKLCAAAGGMSIRTFDRIVSRTSWENVTVKQMEQIARACNVDLLNQQEVFDWIKSELEKPDPFIELNQHGGGRRWKMLAKVNQLCARAIMGQK